MLSAPPAPVVLMPPAQVLVPVSIKILMPIPLLHALKDAMDVHSVQLIVLLLVLQEKQVTILLLVLLQNALLDQELLLETPPQLVLPVLQPTAQPAWTQLFAQLALQTLFLLPLPAPAPPLQEQSMELALEPMDPLRLTASPVMQLKTENSPWTRQLALERPMESVFARKDLLISLASPHQLPTFSAQAVEQMLRPAPLAPLELPSPLAIQDFSSHQQLLETNVLPKMLPINQRESSLIQPLANSLHVMLIAKPAQELLITSVFRAKMRPLPGLNQLRKQPTTRHILKVLEP